jgi:tetratricopeptide (TPR) repeat protein
LARFPHSEDGHPEEKAALHSAAQGGPLPLGIKGVLEQHITQLSPASQKMMSYAAVLGNAFSFDLLQAMQSSRDEEALLNQIEEALQVRLLTEKSNGAQILYHFWHPLLIEYLYSCLSAARRASLHRHAARSLQETQKGQEEEVATTIVYHLINGGSEPSLLAHYASLAGNRAYKLSAYPEAERYYRLALQNASDLTDDNADRRHQLHYAHLLECLGECVLILGKFDEARQLYEQALNIHLKQQCFSSKEEQQYEAQLHALFWCEIGRTWRFTGNNGKAIECFRQGEITLTQAKVIEGPAWAKIRFEQSHTYWANGKLGEALDMANEALKLFETLPIKSLKLTNASFLTLTQRVLTSDPINLGRVYTLLAGVEVNLGQGEQALNHLNCALAIFEKNNIKTEIANVCCNLADLYMRRSNYTLAQPLLIYSYKLTEEIGSIPIMSVIVNNLGLLAARLGNLLEAETWCKRCLVLAKQINDLFYISLFNSHIAMVLIDRGKLDEAATFLLQALKISRSQRITPCVDFALVTLGRLRIAQAQANKGNSNKYKNSLKKARRAIQYVLPFVEREVETRLEGSIVLTEALWLLGELDLAQQKASTALEEAQTYGLIWLKVRIQHYLGIILIASGKVKKGEMLFCQAIEHLHNCGMRLEYARALRNYGTVLLQCSSPGKPDYQQGRSYLGKAWEIFLECDAKLDAEGVKHFLNSRGL